MNNSLVQPIKDQIETYTKIIQQELKDNEFLKLQGPLKFHAYTNGKLIYQGVGPEQEILLVKINTFNHEILVEFRDMKGTDFHIGTL